MFGGRQVDETPVSAVGGDFPAEDPHFVVVLETLGTAHITVENIKCGMGLELGIILVHDQDHFEGLLFAVFGDEHGVGSVSEAGHRSPDILIHCSNPFIACHIFSWR